MTVMGAPPLKPGKNQGWTVSTDITKNVRRFPDFRHHEKVWEAKDSASGLHAFIAVHDTTLGPALGGCRMWPYPSDSDAVRDVLRLSHGMSLKAALAGLDLGGGKAVIIGDPRKDKTEALFRAFGRAVEALGGRYITAEDVGTCVQEMDWIGLETDHVVGTTARGEDPSLMTALGVAEGMRAAVRFRLGGDTLSGLTVAVQGLGHVGLALCQRLSAEGASLVVADLDADRIAHAVKTFGAQKAAPGDIHAVAADVFAPCALGGILNDETVPRLRASIVAGSANNQLARASHGEALHKRGILYAPDYVINAGGLISASMSLFGEDPKGAKAWMKVCGIGPTLLEIFATAAGEGSSPDRVADRLARERIERRHQAA